MVSGRVAGLSHQSVGVVRSEVLAPGIFEEFAEFACTFADRQLHRNGANQQDGRHPIAPFVKRNRRLLELLPEQRDNRDWRV